MDAICNGISGVCSYDVSRGASDHQYDHAVVQKLQTEHLQWQIINIFSRAKKRFRVWFLQQLKRLVR